MLVGSRPIGHDGLRDTSARPEYVFTRGSLRHVLPLLALPIYNFDSSGAITTEFVTLAPTQHQHPIPKLMNGALLEQVIRNVTSESAELRQNYVTN